jgi:putative endonuclease
MDLFYVYILFSPSSKKYYIGQTSNLATRLKQHNHLSTNSFTSKYRPWILKISMEFSSRRSAIKVEKYLKKKPRSYIRRVITEADLRKYVIDKFGSAV